MVEFNLDGKAPVSEKYDVPKDSYEAQIVKIGDIIEAPKYKNPDEMVEKISIIFKLNVKDVKVQKVTLNMDKTKRETIAVDFLELPMYLSTTVSKGSGDYSNSKMYDLLMSANKISKLREYSAAIYDANDEEGTNHRFMQWLEEHLVGKKCKVSIKKSRKGTEEEYSTIAEVNRFLDNQQETIKEETVR